MAGQDDACCLGGEVVERSNKESRQLDMQRNLKGSKQGIAGRRKDDCFDLLNRATSCARRRARTSLTRERERVNECELSWYRVQRARGFSHGAQFSKGPKGTGTNNEP